MRTSFEEPKKVESKPDSPLFSRADLRKTNSNNNMDKKEEKKEEEAPKRYCN